MNRKTVAVLPVGKSRLCVFSHPGGKDPQYSLAWAVHEQTTAPEAVEPGQAEDNYTFILEGIPGWLLVREIASLLNPLSVRTPTHFVAGSLSGIRTLEWFLLGGYTWAMLGYITAIEGEDGQRAPLSMKDRYCLITSGGKIRSDPISLEGALKQLRHEMIQYQRKYGKASELLARGQTLANRPEAAEA